MFVCLGERSLFFCLMQRILSNELPILGGCYSSELYFGAKNKSDGSQNHLVKIFDNFSIHVHNIEVDEI